MPPKMELPGWALNGDFLANGSLFALLVSLKTDGDPTGLLDDCPNAV